MPASTASSEAMEMEKDLWMHRKCAMDSVDKFLYQLLIADGKMINLQYDIIEFPEESIPIDTAFNVYVYYCGWPHIQEAPVSFRAFSTKVQECLNINPRRKFVDGVRHLVFQFPTLKEMKSRFALYFETTIETAF